MGFWGKLFWTGLVAYPLHDAEKQARKRDRQAFEDGLKAREEQSRDRPLAPRWFWEQKASPPSTPAGRGDPGEGK